MKAKILTPVLTLLFVLSILPACSQTVDKKNQPNVKINVRVQKDDKGNIISYDSSYVMTWSSDSSSPEQVDSILRNYGIHYGFGTSPMDIDSIFREFSFGMSPFGFHDMMPGFSNDSELYSIHSPEAIIREMERMHKQMLEEMKQFEQSFPDETVPFDNNNQGNGQNKQKQKIKIEGTSI